MNENANNTEQLNPVPVWIKSAGGCLLVVVISVIVWMMSSDDEQPKPLADIETTKLNEADLNKSVAIAETTISSQELAQRIENLEEKLPQLSAQLTSLISKYDTQYEQQGDLIQDQQMQLTSQVQIIEQLQAKVSGLQADIGKISRPIKKTAVIRKRKTVTIPFTLASVDQWGADLYAILRYQGRFHELTLGQVLDGWKVDAIDPTGSVMLSNGKQHKTLTLS